MILCNFKIKIFIYLILKLLIIAYSSETTCLNKGFDSNILTCKSCDSLLKVVGDENLYEDCKTCCTTESETIQKYQSAVLEIDKRFLGGFPEIAKIVKAAKKLKLEVRYSFGARPMLLLYKRDGDESYSEAIPVHSWSQESFKDYLSTYIVPS